MVLHSKRKIQGRVKAELGSLCQGSPSSCRDVLFQMAEVHRQIQNQLEEMLKSFHNELLTQLEQKVELDSRYLSVSDPLVCSCSSLPCTGHGCAMLRGVPRPPDVSPTQTAVFFPRC
uniref:IMD domain-containing protein n=1 Tax=Anas platyrhynchos platyrhynchos TaxID=8840 RepID=A0A493TMI4_ANAPP